MWWGEHRTRLGSPLSWKAETDLTPGSLPKSQAPLCLVLMEGPCLAPPLACAATQPCQPHCRRDQAWLWPGCRSHTPVGGLAPEGSTPLFQPRRREASGPWGRQLSRIPWAEGPASTTFLASHRGPGGEQAGPKSRSPRSRPSWAAASAPADTGLLALGPVPGLRGTAPAPRLTG